MQTISPKKLRYTLEQHLLWVMNACTMGTRAVFRNVDLQGVDLHETNLYGAILECVNLGGADLSSADLRGVNLCYANLRGANLGNAELRGADLRGAKLDGGIVNACRIRGARFTSDALPWLLLRPNWIHEREHVQIQIN
jgi:uncharacterized protein YjbI with pentapeptide repeats